MLHINIFHIVSYVVIANLSPFSENKTTCRDGGPVQYASSVANNSGIIWPYSIKLNKKFTAKLLFFPLSERLLYKTFSRQTWM